MKLLHWAERIAHPPVLLATIAIAIAIPSVAYLGWRNDAAPEAPSDVAAGASALAVETTAVAVATWPVLVQASGVIVAREEVSVATEVGNVRLTGVHVDVGDSVRKGQGLARLDDVELRSQEAELVAELARASAAWRSARLQLHRSAKLDGDAALSDQDLEQLHARTEGAKAEVDAATARLDIKRLQIERTRIVAPYDGVISARSAVVGTLAASGQPLFRVLRDNRLEWRAELTAAQLAQVHARQPVALVLPDGSRAAGSVRQVAPTVDPQTRMGLAYVDISPGSHARAGMYAAGLVHAGVANALVVPASAVVVRDGRTSVAQLQPADGAHQVAMRTVAVGRRQGDAIEVVDGLRPGDEVVLSGAGLLSDGDRVRVISAERRVSAAVPGVGQ